MDNITESIKALGIQATGFFDLPGELRNEIYTHILQDQSTYAEVTGFAVSHPRIGYEFLSRLGRLRLTPNELNTFLDDFYPPSQMSQRHELHLELCMDITYPWREYDIRTVNRPIDIIRLASMFRQCPNLSMTTTYKCDDARTVDDLAIPRLLDAIRSNDNWASPRNYISKLELDSGWNWRGARKILWPTERPWLAMRLLIKNRNATEHKLTDAGCVCGGSQRALIEEAMEALGMNPPLWTTLLDKRCREYKRAGPHQRIAHIWGL
ncbi:hypothetical protein FB567DRAFT_608411 [Paraphoma chrysanthemicola]|uniref:Uncharacterized protein n=1 Tax=Paraphoma chrysanthemicola TaxID=798071 RepID=A0A8K0QYE4_9PLEO|nr:hypothetical protein FB567DRAFT_608411 [Paraphoma chrysanthemicola]